MTDGKHYQIDVTTVVAYLADQSEPGKDQYVFAYTIKVTNAGNVSTQTDQPSLDHHRCRPARAGSEGPWCRGPAAGSEAWRELRIHLGHQPPHVGRHHARRLPDGGRGRPCVRRRDSAIHAVGAAHAALRRPAHLLRVSACHPARPYPAMLLASPFAQAAGGPPDDAQSQQKCHECLNEQPFHRRSPPPCSGAVVVAGGGVHDDAGAPTGRHAAGGVRAAACTRAGCTAHAPTPAARDFHTRKLERSARVARRPPGPGVAGVARRLPGPSGLACAPGSVAVSVQCGNRCSRA